MFAVVSLALLNELKEAFVLGTVTCALLQVVHGGLTFKMFLAGRRGHTVPGCGEGPVGGSACAVPPAGREGSRPFSSVGEVGWGFL